MVRLLVQDHIRRVRAGYWVAGVGTTLVWFSLAALPVEPGLALGMSLMMVFTFGTLMSLIDLSSKAVRVLPVSREELWHARWILATVVPAAATATGRAVAVLLAAILLRTSHIQPETLVLATLYDLAYLGVGSGLLVVLSRPRADGSVRVYRVINAAAVVAFMGAMGAPLLFGRYLPDRWADFGAVAGLALAAGLGLAAGSYWLVPRPMARLFTLPLPPVAGPRASSPVDWRPVRAASGALSILRLLVRKCAGFPLVLGTVAVILVLFLGGDFRAMGTSLWIAGIGMRSDWRGRLRPLRTLPLGTWRLNALILGTPVGQWLALWCTATLLHVCFPAAVAGLPAHVIAALIGVTALIDAVELPLRVEAQVAIRISVIMFGTMALTFAGGLQALNQFSPRAVWLASCAAGAAGLALAAWLNHRTLTRSHDVYRPSKQDLTFA